MTEFAPGLHAAIGKDVDVSAYDCFTGRWSRLFVPDVIAAAEVAQDARSWISAQEPAKSPSRHCPLLEPLASWSGLTSHLKWSKAREVA